MFKKYEKGDPRRLKMLVFGDTGSGKTVTALQMPSPAVIDTERGCDWYKTTFSDAGILQTSDPIQIRQAIREISDAPNGYKTLVIDSFTIFQEAIEERHLNKKRAEKGNPNYTFTPLDYKYLKSATRSVIHDLLSVDLNIVCTAKAKPIYDNTSSDFMGKVIGYQPEVRKDVPYLFDVVLELRLNDDGTRLALVHKDRTNTLPRVIEGFDYQKLAELFGEEDLQRDPIEVKSALDADQRRNRTHEIEMDGEKVKTAGVTAETLTAIINVLKDEGISKDDLQEKLLEDYGQDSLTSLREDEAQLLLKDLSGEIENED